MLHDLWKLYDSVLQCASLLFGSKFIVSNFSDMIDTLLFVKTHLIFKNVKISYICQ